MTKPASFPAIQCKMGDWKYYSTMLPFKEVASRIQRASEINTHPGLDNMLQRELGRRIIGIAEYLQTQPERFFSAIVVGVYGGSPDWFPIEIDDDRGPEPANLSERAGESLGILRLSGDERLFAVDGQHRVEAIKKALLEDPALASEELAVLFVAHQDTAEGRAITRRLFTTLNKYAKPVTKSEIIALDEDDAFAVVTRMIVNDYEGLNRNVKVNGQELSLVRFEGAQIPSSDSRSITTIRTLYDLLTTLSVPQKSPTRRKELKQAHPGQETIKEMYADHEIFWNGLKEHIPEMREALGSNPAMQVAAKHRHRDGGHILFRPVGQEAFARALRALLDRDIPIQQAIAALSSTQLMLNQDPWTRVMWDPSRNVMNRTNLKLAESLLLHMVHEPPTDPKFQLEAAYQSAVGYPSAKLDDIPKGQPAR